MKRKVIYNVLSGFPIGIAISFLWALFVSIAVGDGSFYPVAPGLAAKAGSELNAVILQTFLCGALGSVFKGASVIWELESWSLLKQSGIYFAIGCAAMLLAAYMAGWMHPSVMGVIFYIAVFAVIFLLIWMIQYLFWKNKVEQLNKKMQKGSGMEQPD